jgi:hypothetical protein
MPDVPERYVDETDLTGDQMLEVVQARRRGESEPRFERKEYQQHRADVLREGGLDSEADEVEAQAAGLTPIEDMSPAQHLERIQRGRR